MAPHSTILLGLVLCMGQMTHAQNGLHPRPSIRAEPGPVVSRGQPVTILCKGPAWADSFRLEKEKNIHAYMDQKAMPQSGSLETEVRFLIPSVSEATAGHYRCAYEKMPSWSERSEVLELVLTDEDVSVLPSEAQTRLNNNGDHGMSAMYVYILLGVSVAFLLCLLLLAFLLVRHQHQKKHGPLNNQGEEQWPQERLSPNVDIIERTPGVATVDVLPEKNGEMHTPSPAAGEPQEVTYAQLDHRILTLRAARDVSPQTSEPMADSSTYAALARH